MTTVEACIGTLDLIHQERQRRAGAETKGAKA